MTIQAGKIHGIFSCPAYITKRDTNISLKEKKEIDKLISVGMKENIGNTSTENYYIFNTGKLKKIKQFFEQQINIYVEQIIKPREELDFYITQSWLNVTKPGEYHHHHSHQNSIISGVYYIQSEESDKIHFEDPNIKIKELILIKPREFNIFNSSSWFFPSRTNELVIFPSWLNHRVESNKKATTDRISLAFNTFVKGKLGADKEASELILT